MKTGMLWFDNDTKSDLPAKIARAADYYQRKYGQKPQICFVHPSMINNVSGGNTNRSQDIEIRTTRQMLPNHLWLGLTEAVPV